MASKPDLLGVEEAAQQLGVSTSTVWRLIRRGALSSVRKGGRRLVPGRALTGAARKAGRGEIPPFTREHPIFRLAGAYRSDGKGPGSSDKQAVLLTGEVERQTSGE